MLEWARLNLKKQRQTVNAARLAQIEQLFHVALELDLEKRSTFLNEVCADDVELKNEVTSLIAEAVNASAFQILPASGSSTALHAGKRLGS